MKCIGYLKKDYEFNGVKGFNYYLNCIYQSEHINGFGIKQYKVKPKFLEDNRINLHDLLDKDITVYFDEFKNIIRLDINK